MEEEKTGRPRPDDSAGFWYRSVDTAGMVWIDSAVMEHLEHSGNLDLSSVTGAQDSFHG